MRHWRPVKTIVSKHLSAAIAPHVFDLSESMNHPVYQIAGIVAPSKQLEQQFDAIVKGAVRLTLITGRLKQKRGWALVQMARTFGPEAEQHLYDVLMESFGLKYRTLQQEAWVASVFGPDKWIKGVDWSLHRLVTQQAIPHRERIELLKLSRDEGWTCAGATSGDCKALRRRRGRQRGGNGR